MTLDMAPHSLFTPESDPKLILHDEGHKFPNVLKTEDFKVLKKFVYDQFVSKNGSDEGFQCEFEQFNFLHPIESSAKQNDPQKKHREAKLCKSELFIEKLH